MILVILLYVSLPVVAGGVSAQGHPARRRPRRAVAYGPGRVIWLQTRPVFTMTLTSQPGDWRLVTDGDSSAVADTRYPPMRGLTAVCWALREAPEWGVLEAGFMGPAPCGGEFGLGVASIRWCASARTPIVGAHVIPQVERLALT